MEAKCNQEDSRPTGAHWNAHLDRHVAQAEGELANRRSTGYACRLASNNSAAAEFLDIPIGTASQAARTSNDSHAATTEPHKGSFSTAFVSRIKLTKGESRFTKSSKVFLTLRSCGQQLRKARSRATRKSTATGCAPSCRSKVLKEINNSQQLTREILAQLRFCALDRRNAFCVF